MDVRRVLSVVPALAVVAGVGLVVMGFRAAPPDIGPVPPDPMLSVPAKDGVSAFEMDAEEVSVGEYESCVRAGACTLHVSATSPESTLLERHYESAQCSGGRPDRREQVMNCVDLGEARAYCKWAGKRLLTLPEWKQGVGAKHPTSGFELHRLNAGKQYFAGEWTVTPSTTKDGKSQEGLFELGAWLTDLTRNFAPYAAARTPLTRSPTIGFRCAK